MVRLESKDTTFGGIFYFKNMEDCKEFMHVFSDHWCNVPWKAPIEQQIFPEVDSSYFSELCKDPKKRAEDNLSWGFSLMKRTGANLTNRQNNFIQSFIEENGGLQHE